MRQNSAKLYSALDWHHAMERERKTRLGVNHKTSRAKETVTSPGLCELEMELLFARFFQAVAGKCLQPGVADELFYHQITSCFVLPAWNKPA